MSEHILSLIVLGFASGYALGSIPFGLIVVYLSMRQDIRNTGSGNIGATNVLRTGRKGLAFLTLMLDAVKGAGAVYLCSLWLPFESAAAAGFGAVIGHCFPVWLRFVGGKGVATGMAVIVVMSPFTGLVMAVIWLLVATLSRLSSLAALLSFVAAGVFVSFGLSQTPQAIEFSVWAIGVLIWFRHKKNIQRVVKGEENQISFKKPPSH